MEMSDNMDVSANTFTLRDYFFVNEGMKIKLWRNRNFNPLLTNFDCRILKLCHQKFKIFTECKFSMRMFELE